MILTGTILGAIALIYVGSALAQVYRFGIDFRQALLYLPLKLVWRIRDSRIRVARQAEPPVIYAVAHQSRLDPALMLSLLPDETLHILDEDSATSSWMEPYRTLARTIAFNPKHVFVSRRLVRHLRGGGRLAVYFPHTVEPDAKEFRLFRAVARIAVTARADIVPVHVEGAQNLPAPLAYAGTSARRWFPVLRIMTLEPASLDAQATRPGRPPTTASNALFDRVAEARIAAAAKRRTLFGGFASAATLYGSERIIAEDPVTGSLTYRRLLVGARVLASRFAKLSSAGEAVGLMLPNTNGLVTAFVALQSAGCAAAMINYTAGPANVTAAIRMARIRTVVSSRAFVEKAQLQPLVEAIDKTGARLVWLEDIHDSVSTFEKLAASVLWRRPMTTVKPDATALILFTSGSEGAPKGVVLSHANILANTAQIEARIRFSPADTLFNVLPAFHAFGLTGGTILPLLYGVRLFLYPSALHYKQIPDTARKVQPTIMFGTDTFLAAYARTAEDEDFASLRLVVAGAEAVRGETRRVWRERFGAEIVEGYGLTEASPVVAVNSRTHSREGTVGRLLAGIRARLEPVEGIEDGGRLWISGPNVMKGYLSPERPGEIGPPADGWHDTGDIVSFDREGYLTIRGRAKRFAKIAGEMVSLGGVEALATTTWPEGRHAAVALPDARRGERIVLVTTQAAADRAALRRSAKASGASEMTVPDHIVEIAEIPLLGTGKTDYTLVRKAAMEELGVDEPA